MQHGWYWLSDGRWITRFIVGTLFSVGRVAHERFGLEACTRRACFGDALPERFQAFDHLVIKAALQAEQITKCAERAASIVDECPLDDCAFRDLLQPQTPLTVLEWRAVNEGVFVTEALIPCGCFNDVFAAAGGITPAHTRPGSTLREENDVLTIRLPRRIIGYVADVRPHDAGGRGNENALVECFHIYDYIRFKYLFKIS